MTSIPAIDQVHDKMLSHLPLVQWEDHGIGGYEFWGQRCTDTQWVLCIAEDEKEHTVEVPLDTSFEEFIVAFSELSFSAYNDEDDYLEVFPHITMVLWPDNNNIIRLRYTWQDAPAIRP